MIKKMHLVNNKINVILHLLVFASLLSGCSKNEQVPVSQPPAAPKPVATKPVQKVGSSSSRPATHSTTNQFDFSGKKDPFKPFVMIKPVSNAGEMKKSLRDGLPIHNFDVSQFRLIGIVSGAKDNQAMVVDPSNKGYVLKVGMTIGKNEGKIMAINSNGVDVLEQFKDDNGRVRKENIRITLPRKQ